ncbi:MAG: hypothetical protein WBH05_14750 [Syntrophobacteria bacterium]
MLLVIPDEAKPSRGGVSSKQSFFLDSGQPLRAFRNDGLVASITLTITHNHTSLRILWQADKRAHKKDFAF